MLQRFLTPTDVAEELAVSRSQVDALLRRGDLRALKVGGRGTWRIERSELEAYISRAYDDTHQWIQVHPYTDEDDTT